jgi:hypothetical protein
VVGIAVGYEIISNRGNIKVVKIYGVLNIHKEYGGISRVNDSQATVRNTGSAGGTTDKGKN